MILRGVWWLAVLGVAAQTMAWPRVVLKIAVDQNGAVDDLASGPKRFTCAAALDEVHRIRTRVDAVLVGVGTVVRDDPSLTVRRVALPAGRSQPLRVVVDPSLRTPHESVLLKDGLRTLLIARDTPEVRQRASEYEIANVQVRALPAEGGELAPAQMLELLEAEGVKDLLVEGGPSTARRFLATASVDELILVRAATEFREPVAFDLSDEIMVAAQLELRERSTWDVDDVTFYEKRRR